MKAWRKTCALVLAVLLLSALPVTACAVSSRFEVFIRPESEELSCGLCFLLQNGDERFFVCANYSNSYTFYIKDDGQEYPLEKLKDFEDIGIYSSAYPGETTLEARCPRKGEAVKIRYTIEESDQFYSETISAEVGELARNSRGVTLLEIKLAGDFAGTLELFPCPALAYSNDGAIAGALVEADGNYYLYLDWFDEASFNSPLETAPESTDAAGAEAADKNSDETKGAALKNNDLVKEPDSMGWKQIAMIVLGVIAALAVVLAVVLAVTQGKRRDKKNRRDKEQKIDVVQENVSTITNSEDFKTKPLNDPANGSDPGYSPTSPMPSSRIVLACSGGYHEGRRYPVNGTVTIGRNPDCSISYPENTPGVSRKHLTLTLQNGVLYFMDTSSERTGTFLLRPSVNRLPRKAPKNQMIALQDGDFFYLGEKKNEYRVCIEQA